MVGHLTDMYEFLGSHHGLDWVLLKSAVSLGVKYLS